MCGRLEPDFTSSAWHNVSLTDACHFCPSTYYPCRLPLACLAHFFALRSYRLAPDEYEVSKSDVEGATTLKAHLLPFSLDRSWHRQQQWLLSHLQQPAPTRLQRAHNPRLPPQPKRPTKHFQVVRVEPVELLMQRSKKRLRRHCEHGCVRA